MESEKIVISAQLENEELERKRRKIEEEIRENKEIIKKYCKHIVDDKNICKYCKNVIIIERKKL